MVVQSQCAPWERLQVSARVSVRDIVFNILFTSGRRRNMSVLHNCGFQR